MTKEEFEKIVGEYVGGLVTERCCGDKGCPSIFCVDSVDGKYPEATTKPMGHATRGIKLENNGGVWFDIDGKPLFNRWAGYYAMTYKADELRYYMGQAGFKRKDGNDPQSYYEKGHRFDGGEKVYDFCRKVWDTVFSTTDLENCADNMPHRMVVLESGIQADERLLGKYEDERDEAFHFAYMSKYTIRYHCACYKDAVDMGDYYKLDIYECHQGYCKVGDKIEWCNGCEDELFKGFPLREITKIDINAAKDFLSMFGNATISDGKAVLQTKLGKAVISQNEKVEQIEYPYDYDISLKTSGGSGCAKDLDEIKTILLRCGFKESAAVQQSLIATDGFESRQAKPTHPNGKPETVGKNKHDGEYMAKTKEEPKEKHYEQMSLFSIP